jgi:signal transduction histidine kinase
MVPESAARDSRHVTAFIKQATQASPPGGSSGHSPEPIDNEALVTGLLAQAQKLQFEDPNIEATFQRDRAQLDFPEVQRTMVLVFSLLLVGASTLLVLNLTQGRPIPPAWLFLRFGVLMPAVGIFGVVAASEWGRQRLQSLLAAAISVIVGIFALEWDLEWDPSMSVRALWLATTVTYIAAFALLPVMRRAAVISTAVGLGLAVFGDLLIFERIGAPTLFGTIVVYAFLGALMCRHINRRERGWREAFVHRRQAALLEARLVDQNQALQALVTQRNDFVAGVLHDLRSPLTGVINTAELLASDPHLSDQERQTMLQRLDAGANRIASFADRFLEQRSLERAITTPVLDDIVLAQVVQSVVDDATVSAARKRQRIELLNSVPDVVVTTDDLLLDRALGNLLSNAMKYGPLASMISVVVSEDPSDARRVRLSVIDAGPGLSADERAQLFQPYTSLGKKPTGEEPSAGLGLSLVKLCVEAMGGAVGCDSAPGCGATFWLAVPKTTAATPVSHV